MQGMAETDNMIAMTSTTICIISEWSILLLLFVILCCLLMLFRLSERLMICCNLLDVAKVQSLNNNRRQSWLVLFIILFALGYFFAHHAQQ
jgi:hypothetical protein